MQPEAKKFYIGHAHQIVSFANSLFAVRHHNEIASPLPRMQSKAGLAFANPFAQLLNTLVAMCFRLQWKKKVACSENPALGYVARRHLEHALIMAQKW